MAAERVAQTKLRFARRQSDLRRQAENLSGARASIGCSGRRRPTRHSRVRAMLPCPVRAPARSPPGRISNRSFFQAGPAGGRLGSPCRGARRLAAGEARGRLGCDRRRRSPNACASFGILSEHAGPPMRRRAQLVGVRGGRECARVDGSQSPGLHTLAGRAATRGHASAVADAGIASVQHLGTRCSIDGPRRRGQATPCARRLFCQAVVPRWCPGATQGPAGQRAAGAAAIAFRP